MMARLLMKCKDKYNKQCTSLVSLTQDYQKKIDFNKSIYEYDWFKEFIEVEFENNKLPIIKAYDDMLKQTYGDYMKLPPKEQQIGHNVEAYWK